jgi:glutaryl-CoA dehydrogenase
MLPPCLSLDKFVSFGLTEPENGSDASALAANAKKTEGGYLLNGQKRWIGNATFADYIIVWARNLDDGKKVQGFVVEKGSEGLITSKMEGKYACRIT